MQLNHIILQCIFQDAWKMAKEAALKHGGYAKEFFAESLRIKWAIIHVKKTDKNQVNQPVIFQIPTAYSSDYSCQNVFNGEWLASEKYNGIFARKQNGKLWSKNGLLFNAPDWFLAGIPEDTEGELFLGKGAGQLGKMAGIARGKNKNWDNVKFMIFNRLAEGGYTERMNALKNAVLPAHVRIVQQFKITDKSMLDKLLHSVMSHGGEGLVIRHCNDAYCSGLSNRIFKLKPKKDTEGIIESVIYGNGKMSNFIACAVVMFNNIKFKLPVYNRVSIADIGKKITFDYQELSVHGVPQQAGFIAIRDYE